MAPEIVRIAAGPDCYRCTAHRDPPPVIPVAITRRSQKFVAAAGLARQNGYARAPSTVVNGITDISAPVKRGERAIAALTVPYIKTTSGASALELRECARPPSGRVSPRLASIVKIGYQ
jgi:DNA-binding IclR family transcriptional regulator